MNTPSNGPHQNILRWGQALLENPYLVAISADNTGTIQAVNRGALLLLGYEHEELVGVKTLAELHDPVELRERAQELTEELGGHVEAGFEALIAKAGDGAYPRQEWCYLRKDGSKLPLLLSVTALWNDDGRVTGFLCIGKDIRQRKQAETALAEAEGRFRSLTEAAFEGISISEHGVVTECNQQLASMFGYSPDELIGMQVTDLVVPEHRELVQEKITSQDHTLYRIEGLRKDGSRFHAEVRGRNLRLRHRSARVTALVDITDRLQAEANLRQSDERFSQVFHANPLGIAISTLEDGRLVDVNESCLRIMGITREQLEGKAAADVGVWPRLEERQEAVAALLATGTYRNWRKQFRHSSGETRTAFVSMRLLELQCERCILTMIQDVTDRERVEEELSRQKRFLEVLLENLHEGVVACDQAGTLSVLNHASREMNEQVELGLPLERWREHHSLYHPDEMTSMRPEDLPLHRALHGEILQNVEALLVPSSGESRLLQVNAQPLFGERGDKLGAVAISHDVTERKAYERELKRSAAFRDALSRIVNEFLEAGPGDRSYASLLEHGVRLVPGAQGGSVLVRTTDGSFRFAAAEGYDLDALSTVRLAEHELVKPPDGSSVMISHNFSEHNRKTLDAERTATLAIGGRTSELHASLAVPVSAGGELAAILNLDNFEREDAFGEQAISMAETFAAQLGVLAQRFSLERQLEESELRLTEAQRIAKLGSWEWDLRSDTMLRSETQPALFGLTKDEFPPNIQGFLGRVHTEDRNDVEEAIERLQWDASPFTFEYRTITPAGEARHHLVRGEVVTDGQGKPQRVIGTTQDVSAQKRVAQDLQRNAEALQRRNQEMKALNQMVEMLQACLHPEEAYDVIRRFGPKLLQTEAGVLYLRDENSATMSRSISWGDAPSHETLTDVDCLALRRNQTYVMDNAQDTLPCRHVKQPVAPSCLCTPLLAHGHALGMLHLQGQAFDEHEIELTRTFADQFALALANLKLREDLREQSIRDPLTDLFNRRYLDETLERELGRAERDGSPVAIVMFDVDHFKAFNDRYGHDAGDLVLQQVADLLQTQTRTEDVPCRYGGEEFALLMPGADQDTAMERADKLRRRAKAMTIKYRGQALPEVTLSLGVAIFPWHATSGSELVRAADRALYRAKNEGRDRVEAVEDPDIEESADVHSGSKKE